MPSLDNYLKRGLNVDGSALFIVRVGAQTDLLVENRATQEHPTRPARKQHSYLSAHQLHVK